MEENKVTGFGRTKKGEEAHLYLLENKNGVKAYLTDYGAALVRLLVPDKNNELRDVVLGYDDTAGYEQGDVFFGATVGRNANRVGGAHVEIAGKVYKLEKNDNDNNLHSGTHYYNKRLWDVVEQADDHVAFVLHSPDGDQGYPGAFDMHVTYTLDDSNELTIHYVAVPDQDTVINMTNHSYFNLNGHASGTVLGHKVTVNADSFTPADAYSIPTGEIRSVEGTPMDFRSGRVLGDDIDTDYEPLRFGSGYDHNWVLKNEGRFDKVAEVASEESGIVMEVYTDLPGVQIYTANFVDGEPGKDGASYIKRSAVCLETQYFPDAVHHENFPQPLCRKGEKYDTRTAYRFLTRG
ncbi:MAG TPA: galactose mutarotase [Candidatus Mediterraneibacter pullicola]|uniref:Aldose 1-epimerase n=1 Tax=Candidatus Mediterraneibacter pullicola TaxID=2838682 RepID=A0A9D2H930_9FIRM|nr:galactose mutarotase [Candidatus Mediterraneibacter pullicola]